MARAVSGLRASAILQPSMVRCRWKIDTEADGIEEVLGTELPIASRSSTSAAPVVFYAVPSTRTPLHKDRHCSVLLHLQGTKQVLCFSQEEVVPVQAC